MKSSALRAALEHLEKEHGDLDVTISCGFEQRDLEQMLKEEKRQITRIPVFCDASMFEDQDGKPEITIRDWPY